MKRKSRSYYILLNEISLDLFHQLHHQLMVAIVWFGLKSIPAVMQLIFI